LRRTTTAQQPQLSFVDPMQNYDLFADHYLEQRIQELEAWQNPDGLEKAFSALQSLYQRRASRFTDATNEAQTEHDFIQPVLDLLWGQDQPGDCYQVQVSIPNVDARRQPDYAFFRTAEERQSAQPHLGDAQYWSTVPCLGDAKRWSASLDKERAADENPSAQIVNYLYRSRVRWGILTNGRHWRLYEQDRSRGGGVYFEVDLESILQHNDRDAFKWFYLFFRREAHLPDTAGKTFLDKVFEGSVAYATEVGDSLKESVYDALRLLMTGFAEVPQNQLDLSDEASLKLLHDDCLILLYRLLFVLYAEDRGLLPCEEPHYATYSLRTLHQEVNQSLRQHRPYLPMARRFWNQLCGLFQIIDQGFESEGRWIIPAYNGGLFNPEKHPNIAYEPQAGHIRWEIGDNRLAEVVDMLAYRRQRWDEPGSQDIDYTTLAVQHLGSIYEGLLELQPRVAEEDLIETVDGGKPIFKPAAEVPNPRNLKGQPPRSVAEGEVYLVSSRGERKAMGSYYTPAFIVDYIVEHTIGPLAEEAAQKTEALAGELRELQKRLDRTQSPEALRNLTAQRDDLRRRLTEPYLSLRILDPAMGSGHFLVGAADFLSLAMATDPNLPEPEDLGDEEPQVHYKRLIVEQCLCGVDLNPLAVELAKLSLWLHTVSRDKALSFLDYHLRCGNSLIGAWVEKDLTREPPRFTDRGKRVNADSAQTVLGFTQALGRKHLQPMLDALRQITQSPGTTAEDEHLKERLYEDLEHIRDRFRQVANCWIAPFFGVPVTPEQYQEAVDALQGNDGDWEAVAQQEWFEAVQAKATNPGLRFFHWELEFPECFFGPSGLKAEKDRGFDAVIGNPPYSAKLSLETRVLTGLFEMVEYKCDPFAFFLEQGLGLAGRHRWLGMIVPATWMTNVYYERLRRKLLGERSLSGVLLFEGNVFPDANVDTSVVVAHIEGSEAGTYGFGISPSTGIGGEWVLRRYEPALALARAEVTALHDVRWEKLFGVFTRCCCRLGDVATISLGMKLEANDKFVRTGASPDVPDVIYFGDDVARYRPLRPVHYFSHAKANVVGGTKNPDVYAAAPKILLQAIRNLSLPRRIVATIDYEGAFFVGTLNGVVVRGNGLDPHYVKACLSSQPINAFFANRFVTISLTASFLGEVPIRLIDFDHATPSDDKSRLLDSCTSALEAGDYDLPLALATQALATHALLHGPAGKQELREDPYWAEQIAGADPDFAGREDFVHDLLAMLAQRMMDLNRQKHEATDQFLTWLEHLAGCEVEALSNKTKLQAFWEHDTHTLTGILRTNRRKLSVDPTTSGFIKDFVREYDQAKGTLTPLIEALTRTDRLIDQIVYKLYGLTEEEVRIVEGTEDKDV
jgi:hypothetical protein